QPRLAGHLLGEVGRAEQLAGLGPAVPAAGAVGAGLPAGGGALAGHDVAAGAHGARDDTEVAGVGPDGALPRDPQLAAVVDLGLGEVVVAVHRPGDRPRPQEREHLGNRRLHHLGPVGLGVVLGPEHV